MRLLLIYPRLISFGVIVQVGRRAMEVLRVLSVMDGCKRYPLARSLSKCAGTRRAVLSQKDFLLPFLVFQHEGPPAGMPYKRTARRGIIS